MTIPTYRLLDSEGRPDPEQIAAKRREMRAWLETMPKGVSLCAVVFYGGGETDVERIGDVDHWGTAEAISELANWIASDLDEMEVD